MSPSRDPGDRNARRFLRDIAHAHEAGPRQPSKASLPGGDLPAAPPTPSAAWSDEALDAAPLREKHTGSRSDRVRRRAEQRQARGVDGPPPTEELLAAPARVVATARGPCEVELADGSRHAAQLPKALARDDRSTVAVGDEVMLGRRSSGELSVVRLLPRRSRLSRPDPFLPHREHVLVANLDLAVIVASVRRPPMSTGLVDRFLIALARGEVPAAVAVNKIDLMSEAGDEELERLEPYRRLDLPIVLCSAHTARGLDELRSLVAGKTVAFVGHSGVGKSSLVNALVPAAAAIIGRVSEASSRGRHTTSHARIYRIADGTRIVDTPGVREFGLWKMEARELAGYFEEFAVPAARCRFGNCSHRHEPACAVREAAESGEIAPERFATYLRVLASLDEL